MRGSGILKWSSDEYIGIHGAQLDLSTNDTEGSEKHVDNLDTYATLIRLVRFHWNLHCIFGQTRTLECHVLLVVVKVSKVSTSLFLEIVWINTL